MPSTELAAKIVVVAGGTSVAGEAVVAALLDRGATVLVPSRSAEKLAGLLAAHPSDRLHGYDVGMDRLEPALGLVERILAEHARIDAAVAALGGWWEGTPLTQLDEQTWRLWMDAGLNSHFVAARALLPALLRTPGSVYVWLGGIAGDHPQPHAGPISVSGAGQRMLAQVLAKELEGRDIRLHEVAIRTPVVTRHWPAEQAVQPWWLSGEKVGEYVADVVSRPPDGDLVLSIPY